MTKIQPERARQGKLGRPVLLVLVASIVLALIVWAGVEMWGQAIEPPTDQSSRPNG